MTSVNGSVQNNAAHVEIVTEDKQATIDDNKGQKSSFGSKLKNIGAAAVNFVTRIPQNVSHYMDRVAESNHLPHSTPIKAAAFGALVGTIIGGAAGGVGGAALGAVIGGAVGAGIGYVVDAKNAVKGDVAEGREETFSWRKVMSKTGSEIKKDFSQKVTNVKNWMTNKRERQIGSAFVGAALLTAVIAAPVVIPVAVGTGAGWSLFRHHVLPGTKSEGAEAAAAEAKENSSGAAGNQSLVSDESGAAEELKVVVDDGSPADLKASNDDDSSKKKEVV